MTTTRANISTVSFATRPEAMEWLAVNDFRRLPVKGSERWSATEWSDDGRKGVTFASAAGRDEIGNVIAFDLVTYY